MTKIVLLLRHTSEIFLLLFFLYFVPFYAVLIHYCVIHYCVTASLLPWLLCVYKGSLAYRPLAGEPSCQPTLINAAGAQSSDHSNRGFELFCGTCCVAY